jgi:chromosome segregation ATPase
MANKIQLPPRKSFGEIWAIMQEISKTQQEISKTQKEISESSEKHNREIAEIRAIQQETAESMKENTESMKEIRAIQQETAESMKETDRRLKEAEQLIKENGKQMGFVQNRLGEVVEHIVIPNISEKFKILRYNFGAPRRNVKFYDRNLNLLAEADIVMADDNENLMIGEVKTTLTKKDVDRHVERLEKLRNEAYSPAMDGRRRLMGFMAGAIVDDRVKEYAHQNGFFVAVQSGDTMKLEVPDGFVPKTW